METILEGTTLRISLNANLPIDRLWKQSLQFLRNSVIHRVEIHSANEYAPNGAETALIVFLEEWAAEKQKDFAILGLSSEGIRLIEFFKKKQTISEDDVATTNLIVTLGRISYDSLTEIMRKIEFTGEVIVSLFQALRNWRKIRGKDILTTIEAAGSNGLPIVALVGFLLGLIFSFQSAIPMKRFGTEIYVANLVALGLIRELGPLITAVLLAGRTGSSFAAEIGTMTVNEEVDALVTMGLSPVMFLVVPRIIAGIFVMPLLTLFFNFMGLIGSLLVFLSLGFPYIVFVNQCLDAVTMVDFVTGLSKAFTFGILVSAIGCYRGLRTGSSASAVGLSTTGAVVDGIVLIAVCDGIFAVVLYFLGI